MLCYVKVLVLKKKLNILRNRVSVFLPRVDEKDHTGSHIGTVNIFLGPVVNLLLFFEIDTSIDFLRKGLLATSGVAPCWSFERILVSGTPSLPSLSSD